MKFPLVRRSTAQRKFEECLDAMISNMYRNGIHDQYSVTQMKKLLIERFKNGSN